MRAWPADHTGVSLEDRATSADGLLDEFWEPEPPAMARRELATEAVGAVLLALLAAGLAVVAPDGGAAAPWTWPVFVLAYALAGSVKFHVGATFAVPTQLVLVPMLLLLPPGMVVPVVAAGLLVGSLPEAVMGRQPPGYLLTAIGDAWHALGAAAVIALAGGAGWGLDALWLYAASFVAQAAVDSGTIVLRQWIGRGIPPRRQSGVVGVIQGIDVLLWPVGFLAAVAGRDHGLAWTLVLAVPLLLALLARDRARRVAQAQERLEALNRERTRLEQAIRRVGEAFATNLDADRLVELALHTAVDATGAEGGRVVVDERADTAEGLGGLDADGLATLAAAEDAAADRGRAAATSDGDRHAMACPIPIADRASRPPVISVTRSGAPFSADERELLGYLAGQAAISIQNAELHQQLRHQALTDSLTGLANHRRFQERLDQELGDARRHGHPVALVLIDLDDFKAINDGHGHLVGDLVLQSVAAVVRGCCRAIDEPARYGGEELALLLPRTTGDEALAVAERVRRRIEEQVVEGPDGLMLRVTASMGLAVAHDFYDASGLIARADSALYAAKAQGKNCSVRDPGDGALAAA